MEDFFRMVQRKLEREKREKIMCEKVDLVASAVVDHKVAVQVRYRTQHSSGHTNLIVLFGGIDRFRMELTRCCQK